VVRDENGETKRDILTGEPLTRECRHHALIGTDPPKCLQHASPMERQKRMQDTFMARHSKDVLQLLQALDIPDLNPMDGLLEAVRVSGGMMRMFQVLVSELPEGPRVENKLIDGIMTEVVTSGVWGYDHNMDQAPHVLMNLLTMWTDRYTRACKMAIDAGLDERLVRNAEVTSNTLLGAFDRALKAVNLTEEAQMAIKQAMAQEIRKAVSPQSTPMEVSA